MSRCSTAWERDHESPDSVTSLGTGTIPGAEQDSKPSLLPGELPAVPCKHHGWPVPPAGFSQLMPHVRTQLCQTRLCQSSTRGAATRGELRPCRSSQGRGLAAPALCPSACPGWGLESAPNPFLTSLKSNIWDQPLLLQLQPFCWEQPRVYRIPAEHPAILPCKEQGIVPNSAVLTLSATTTNREAERGKNQLVEAGLKKNKQII